MAADKKLSEQMTKVHLVSDSQSSSDPAQSSTDTPISSSDTLKATSSSPLSPPSYSDVQSDSRDPIAPPVTTMEAGLAPSAPPLATLPIDPANVAPRVHPEGPPPSYDSICEQPKFSSPDRYRLAPSPAHVPPATTMRVTHVGQPHPAYPDDECCCENGEERFWWCYICLECTRLCCTIAAAVASN